MNKEFQVHILNDEGIARAKEIGKAFDVLMEELKLLCLVESREFSITRTKLEEACFFAKKSMAINPLLQRKEGDKI